MHEAQGKNIIVQLKKKWIYKALLSEFLLALAMTIFIFTLLYKLFLLPLYFALPCLAILFSIILLFKRSWKLSEWDVSRFLNITNPSLEESAQLVLKSPQVLNLFERLQVKKVESELFSFKAPDPFSKRLNTSLILLLIAVAVSFILIKIPYNPSLPNHTSAVKNISLTKSIPEKILPQIKTASIVITPPSYTRKVSKQQYTFNLSAEEGAVVSWEIQTNIQAKMVTLIFNDGAALSLTNDDKHLNWKTQKLIRAAGFYQVKIDDKLSDLYKVELMKDQPPAITIQSPEPNTSIDYGEPEKVMLKATLADDYGIASANISATISRGRGEGVKFREQKLPFANFIAGNREQHLQKLIDCKALEMQPGDELYFYVSVTDNHQQEARSDVYIVTLQDTTGLSSMDGLVSPLDIKPELFRSQRQIIIETEQLLKDKATLTAEEFKKKSNDLGIDQQLLRLRYGKFLGEETNVEIGGDNHKEEHAHEEHASNNANEIMEQYGHSHDNAEDATFFDAETKKQLKETLAEMWKAELKLRTFLPKDALPYEYKALRLLKDLQQKSRVYVQKTGFKPTPLNPDKRLSGDLSKINQPVTRQDIKTGETSAITIRRAFGVLEQLKVSNTLSASSQQILQEAFRQLSMSAANQPAAYLTSLSSLKKILNENYTIKDIDLATQGLQKMTADAERLPYPGSRSSMNLSNQYFINLHKGGTQ